jgi:hypothetical protein
MSLSWGLALGEHGPMTGGEMLMFLEAHVCLLLT